MKTIANVQDFAFEKVQDKKAINQWLLNALGDYETLRLLRNDLKIVVECTPEKARAYKAASKGAVDGYQIRMLRDKEEIRHAVAFSEVANGRVFQAYKSLSSDKDYLNETEALQEAEGLRKRTTVPPLDPALVKELKAEMIQGRAQIEALAEKIVDGKIGITYMREVLMVVDFNVAVKKIRWKKFW